MLQHTNLKARLRIKSVSIQLSNNLAARLVCTAVCSADKPEAGYKSVKEEKCRIV